MIYNIMGTLCKFMFNIINVIFLLLMLILFCRESFAADKLRASESIIDGGQGLVSQDGLFELGFFSPGNTKSRYLGIWYNKNVVSVHTVVWVANPCNPVFPNSSGLFTINDTTGNLVILDKNNKSVIWSTSLLLSNQPQKLVIELLNSGNLVLRDLNDQNPENFTYLWQSFDYPSNTFLPGMRLGWGPRNRSHNRQLTTWKNIDDPCSGDLSYRLEPRSYPELYIRNGPIKKYRTGPWNGRNFSGSLHLRPPVCKIDFVHNNDDEVYFTYTVDNEAINRIVLNPTTSSCQRFQWSDDQQDWSLHSSAPNDYCDMYGLCGPNGNCVPSSSPICQCLKGFRPKSQEKWKSSDWAEGCVRTSPMRCQDNEKDGFFKLMDIKVPDTNNTWVNASMDLKECKAKCLSNCSCMAYSNIDIRGQGSGCAIWFGDLVDIRQIPGSGHDLYIRMQASELPKGDRKVKVLITASVIGVFSVMLSAGYLICRRSLRGKNKRSQKNDGQEEDLELPLFDLSTISTATDNFSVNNKLGEGGFGPVYRGKLEDGQEIAVKRLSMTSGQGVKEFKNEVNLIAKLQHRNLVKLLGYCIHGEENLLVYEYMPNNSLDSFIFDQIQGKLLEWPKRFQIICGIARGLLYLHQDSRLRIIHRDLKTSNVLLDSEMNPKISDFGMARSFRGDQIEGNTKRVVGTYGYMAPEYAFNGLFSIKSDIFSFGIVVLEIVSGKRSGVFRPQDDTLTLTGHAWKLMMEGRALELLDECLRDSQNSSEVLRCINIGLLCVQQRHVDRPNMSSVVSMLSSENSVLPQPRKPGYFMEPDPPQGYSESPPTNELTISVLEAR